jgi:hypothetical protein
MKTDKRGKIEWKSHHQADEDQKEKDSQMRSSFVFSLDL